MLLRIVVVGIREIWPVMASAWRHRWGVVADGRLRDPVPVRLVSVLYDSWLSRRVLVMAGR